MLRQIKLKLSQLRLESEIEGNYTDAPAWSTTTQPQSVTIITNINNANLNTNPSINLMLYLSKHQLTKT